MKVFTSRITLFILLILSLIATSVLSITLSHYTKEKKPIVLNADRLLQKLAAPPPEWMMQRIQADLAPFKDSGITHAMIDDLYRLGLARKYSLIRFRIDRGHLSFTVDEKQADSRHFRHLLASLQKLSETVPLPDVDVVLSLEDGFDANPPGFPLSPCLVFAKSDKLHNFILMPDFKALGGYGKLRQQILDGNEQFAWNKKKDKAFWRGSSTSGFFTADNWNQFCRGKLVLLSLLHPLELDARFTNIVQCTPDVPALMKERKMVASPVDKVDHLSYKYLVDVDGNSCTYERCFWLLLSNSLLLKQITPNVQWYYGGLKPNVHFLPIEEDLSNLMEQLYWAREHDDAAQQMAALSTEFVKENLSTESIFHYMVVLLNEYAKLQR